MISNYTIMRIETEIARITKVLPEVYTRENSKNLLVIFQKEIPSVEETAKIHDALKEFGNPIKTEYRDNNYVSFLILKN